MSLLAPHCTRWNKRQHWHILDRAAIKTQVLPAPADRRHTRVTHHQPPRGQNGRPIHVLQWTSIHPACMHRHRVCKKPPTQVHFDNPNQRHLDKCGVCTICSTVNLVKTTWELLNTHIKIIKCTQTASTVFTFILYPSSLSNGDLKQLVSIFFLFYPNSLVTFYVLFIIVVLFLLCFYTLLYLHFKLLLVLQGRKS